MKPTLYIFLGIPGSGKTHFVKQLCKKMGLVHLSSDHMRLSMFDDPDRFTREVGNPMVFGALDYAVHEILKTGHPVAYDTNHNFRRVRDKTRKLAQELEVPTVLVWVKVPLEVAIHRASERPLDEYTVHVSAERVVKQSEILEAPGEDEKHIIIDGTLSFDDQFASFHQQL